MQLSAVEIQSSKSQQTFSLHDPSETIAKLVVNWESFINLTQHEVWSVKVTTDNSTAMSNC